MTEQVQKQEPGAEKARKKAQKQEAGAEKAEAALVPVPGSRQTVPEKPVPEAEKVLQMDFEGCGHEFADKLARQRVSDLAAEFGLTRKTVYKHLADMGVKPNGQDGFSGAALALVRETLAGCREIRQGVVRDNDALDAVRTGADCGVEAEDERSTPPEPDGRPVALNAERQSTLEARLANAKSEYNYNAGLITMFQRGIDAYVRENGKTTAVSNTGVEATIPMITSLEKYIKLNVTLSKTISELENELKLSAGAEGSDPFGWE